MRTKVIQRSNLKNIYIALAIALFLLLGLYLYQVNSHITAKYSIGDYTTRINKLIKENRTLEVNLAKGGSLSNLSNEISQLNFVKTDKIDYIQIIDSSVVIK